MLLETSEKHQNEISPSDLIAEQCSSGVGAAANSLLLGGLLGMCDMKGCTCISTLSLNFPLQAGAVSTCLLTGQKNSDVLQKEQ